MEYRHAEPLIKTGDILTFKGTWLVSRGIQYVTGQEQSHIGIAVWLHLNGSRRLCLFESMEGSGVRILPLKRTLEDLYWAKGGKVWWHSYRDQSIDGDKVMKYCFDLWGAGYANHYQFVVILSPLIKKIRKFLGRSFDTDINRWHCSELVCSALINQGYKHDKDPAITTPGDIAKFPCITQGTLLERDHDQASN